jgi:hypothetical protein
MHEDFARWYASVSVDDHVSRREARWAGVTKIVEEADRPMVEALLRLAFGGRAMPSADEMASIRQAFRAADETFQMSGNDRELQVLAGSALAVLMVETDGSAGPVAALGSTTAGFKGARDPDLPMNLAGLGEAAIVSSGEKNRQRPSLENFFATEPPKVDFEKAVEKVREQTDWDGIAQAFKIAGEATRTSMRMLAQRQAKAVRAIDEFQRIQDEELQMLWWLIGQRSNDYACDFEAVPADAQPLVFASELADNTNILPGPGSIRGLLSRSGLTLREVTVMSAVNAPRADWLEQLYGGDPSPLTMPIHAAVKRQLETGAGDAWVAGWSASTGISSEFALPDIELSELFYRERLLLLFE